MKTEKRDCSFKIPKDAFIDDCPVSPKNLCVEHAKLIHAEIIRGLGIPPGIVSQERSSVSSHPKGYLEYLDI